MNSLKFQDRLLGLQDNLLNFAYMLTANREEAKDLLQDTTLKALDNEDKYIDNVNFKGWVFTIMRNIFINNYRRVVRNQTIIDQTEDLYHFIRYFHFSFSPVVSRSLMGSCVSNRGDTEEMVVSAERG